MPVAITSHRWTMRSWKCAEAWKRSDLERIFRAVDSSRDRLCDCQYASTHRSLTMVCLLAIC